MRFTTTLILLVIATALGAWIRLDGSRQQSSPGEQGGKVLARFQPETIEEIRIGSKQGEAEIVRRGQLWFFSKPIEDRADRAAVMALLDLLSHLSIRDSLSAKEIAENPQLSDQELGFTEENSIQVILAPDSGKELSLILGKPSPMANTIYARLGGDHSESNITYVVDGNPERYLEQATTSLRDQALLYAPPNTISGLTLRTAKETIALGRSITKGNSGWMMSSPLATRANENLVEKIIAQLSALRVQEVLDATAAANPMPNPVPDGGVVFELQLLGQDEAISVFLAPAKGSAPEGGDKKTAPLLDARVSDRPAAFSVRSSILAELPISANAFRDPHLAHIPIQLLHSIIIQTRDNPDVVLTAMPPANGQITWKSNRNGKREAANLSKIIRLMEAVNEEPILGFVADTHADPADYGLDHPFTAITFNIFQPAPQDPGADPSTLADPNPKKIQRTLQLGMIGDDSNKLFGSFDDEPYIYQLPPSFRNRVSPYPMKWKSPKVLSFSLISLLEIQRNAGDQPPLQLKYDYTRDEWQASEGNKDVSDLIDRRIALKLASTLGSLTAQDWITTSQLAYQALDEPALAFTVVVEEIDPAINQAHKASHTLKFAPAQAGFYYGSLDNSPDIFLIDRDTFRELVRPLTTMPGTLRPGK